jgi:hypothetical protein
MNPTLKQARIATAATPTPPAKGAAAPLARLSAGRVVTALVAAFLLFDGVARVVRFAPYVEGTVRFGFSPEAGLWIGLTLVTATILYLLPRTMVLGAILVTGYLGGATASHVLVGDAWFFPVLMGALAWTGLVLRDPRLAALLPLRS